MACRRVIRSLDFKESLKAVLLEKYSLVQNVLLGLSLAAPIGPVNLEIIRRGLNTGFKQAFLTGLGAMSADFTYLTLIFFGLVSFLKIPSIKIGFALAGSFILMYLGLTSLRNFLREKKPDEDSKQLFLKNAYAAGYVVTLSCPITFVWWTGVFGALLASQTGTPTNFSAYLSCLTILLGCFIWVVFLSTALHWGRKIVNEKLIRIISLIAGMFLIGFGLSFLYRSYGLMVN